MIAIFIFREFKNKILFLADCQICKITSNKPITAKSVKSHSVNLLPPKSVKSHSINQLVKSAKLHSNKPIIKVINLLSSCFSELTMQKNQISTTSYLTLLVRTNSSRTLHFEYELFYRVVYQNPLQRLFAHFLYLQFTIPCVPTYTQHSKGEKYI